MNKYFFILIMLVATACFTGCDPLYFITVTNGTKDSIAVLVKENYNFSTDKIAFGKTKEGLSVYELSPDEVFKVGEAIAGIDDEMPFDKIQIVRKKDTVSADNFDDIKALFDKTFFGGLKTPYNITVK